MRYFCTDDEVAALELARAAGELPSDPPGIIRGVRDTQLSIARHYGGIKFNDHHYTYFPAGDELIRDDVLKWVTKARKSADKARKSADATKADQGALL